MTTTLSGIIGDNANLHAGVIDRAELDDMMETTWAEVIECPACQGLRQAIYPGFPYLSYDRCEWCEGTGRCARLVAGEWEESLR